MPEAQELHVDSVLTNISKKYENETLIWQKVMPVIPVKKRSNLFFVYSRAEQFRLPDDKIGPKSMANETDFTVTRDNYSVKDYALSEFVSLAEEENADSPLSPRADATEFLTNLLLLAQEKRVADILFNPNIYPAANKTVKSGTAQWNDESGSDPLNDILTGLDSTFVRPNTIVIGFEVFKHLRKHPKIVNAVKAMAGVNISGGLVSLPDLASLFDVKEVLVGRAKYNSSKMGQTESMANIWGKHVAMLYTNTKPSLRSITFGATFSEMHLQTAIIPEPARGVKGGNLIKVAWNSDEKIIANDTGYFIQNAVA